jgi:hypothetical protein
MAGCRLAGLSMPENTCAQRAAGPATVHFPISRISQKQCQPVVGARGPQKDAQRPLATLQLRVQSCLASAERALPTERRLSPNLRNVRITAPGHRGAFQVPLQASTSTRRSAAFEAFARYCIHRSWRSSLTLKQVREARPRRIHTLARGRKIPSASWHKFLQFAPCLS